MSDLSATDGDVGDSPNMRQLREELKATKARASELEAQAARASELERQLTLRDAGLELDPFQLKALGAVHEGDWTPEAIRDTAAKLGFTAPAPAPSTVPAAELAALGRMNAVSSGAPPGPPMDRMEERNNRLLQAKSEQEFDAIVREFGPLR